MYQEPVAVDGGREMNESLGITMTDGLASARVEEHNPGVGDRLTRHVIDDFIRGLPRTRVFGGYRFAYLRHRREVTVVGDLVST